MNQTSMFQTTHKQQTHGEMILDAIRGQWLHSADLVALTQTRNLQARISGLEAAGWTIERRPTTDYRDGVEYKATTFTAKANTGPKQVHLKVPEGCPPCAVNEARATALRIMKEATEEAKEAARVAKTNEGITIADFFGLGA